MAGEVPEGWQNAAFGRLADVDRGLTYSNEQECDAADDGVAVLRIPNVQEQRFVETGLKYLRNVSADERKRYRVGKNAILMVGSNGNAARVGNCCFVDSPAEYVFASFLMRVRPNEERVAAKFLYYCMVSEPVQDGITESVQGSTGLKNISLMTLRSQQFLVPPLAEQRKIAAILSSVDDAIRATEAVIEQTRRVKQALLEELLTRGIGHTRFKQTEIGEIPEGWEVRELGEIATVERGRFSHRPRNAPHLYGGPYPFVQTGDIAGVSRIVSHSQTLNDAGLAQSRMFPVDTILVTIVGANVGEAALTTYPVACPDSVVGIRADAVDPIWLSYVVSTWKSALQSAATQSARQNINLQTLRPKLVAVPPVAEQAAIRAVISVLADAEEVSCSMLACLKLSKSALLSALLTGRIRVTP